MAVAYEYDLIIDGENENILNKMEIHKKTNKKNIKYISLKYRQTENTSTSW